jgi:ribosome-associated translation inhibitor RaiA
MGFQDFPRFRVGAARKLADAPRMNFCREMSRIEKASISRRRVDCMMRIHTNRATVKENRKELFLSLSRAFPYIVCQLLRKMSRKLKQMHAEVVYQAVLAGQLLLALRLVRPMIVSLLKGGNKYTEEVAPW